MFYGYRLQNISGDFLIILQKCGFSTSGPKSDNMFLSNVDFMYEKY